MISKKIFLLIGIVVLVIIATAFYIFNNSLNSSDSYQTSMPSGNGVPTPVEVPNGGPTNGNPAIVIPAGGGTGVYINP